MRLSGIRADPRTLQQAAVEDIALSFCLLRCLWRGVKCTPHLGQMLHHANEDSELSALLSQNKLVVVDFFATWCGPCKYIAPQFEAFSQQFTDWAFVKVDVDENGESAQRYNIRAMPTFVFFVDGKEFKKVQGANVGAIKSLLESRGDPVALAAAKEAARPAVRKFDSFAEFFPFYLTEHSNLICRRLHVLGTSIILAACVFHPWAAVAMVMAAVFGVVFYHSTRHARNGIFEFASMLCMFLTLCSWWEGWQVALMIPGFAYSMAWIGHFVFEKNRPATFIYPVRFIMRDG